MHLEPTEAWYLLRICAALIAIFLLAVHLIKLAVHLTKLKKNVSLFYCWLGAIAVLGGAAAFFLPIAVNSGFAKEDDGAALRQAILYTTGGLLGVITLGETHRKNNQEKEKNENDHTRQVYAERRSRYTKAVEQLANEKAAVRLGGIYTLVGLVDEWLADETLAQEEQQKEGQVIINNLCSYIRSPFPLAEEIEEYEDRKELEKLQKTESEKLSEEESSLLQILLKRFKDSDKYEKPKDITADYAKFHEEQDVRRTIFVEMSKRSSALIKDEKDGMFKTNPRTWSNFDFDFSRAPIFYPLSNLTIEKAIFSSARFYGEADLRYTKFTGNATFRGATFGGKLQFGNPFESLESVNFEGSTFNKSAYFEALSILGEANFESSHFRGDARFRLPFRGNARFENARFSGLAHFGASYFLGGANFAKSTFMDDAYFCHSSFNKSANFKDAEFVHKSPLFAYQASSDGIKYAAEFSSNTPPENYNFEASEKENFHSIEIEEIYDKGKKFIIPKGCTLS